MNVQLKKFLAFVIVFSMLMGVGVRAFASITSDINTEAFEESEKELPPDPEDDDSTAKPGDDDKSTEPGDDDPSTEPGDDDPSTEPGDDDPTTDPGDGEMPVLPVDPEVPVIPEPPLYLEYTIYYYFTVDGEEVERTMTGEVDAWDNKITFYDIQDPEDLPEGYVIDEDKSTLPFTVTEDDNEILVYYIPEIPPIAETLEYTVYYYFTTLEGKDVKGEMKGEVSSDYPVLTAYNLPVPKDLPMGYVIDEENSRLPHTVTEEDNEIYVYYVPGMMRMLNALPGEDVNYIVVEKEFVGITEDQIPEDFLIIVSNNTTSYELRRQDKPHAPNIVFIDTGDPLVLRWRINNADIGTYTVSESGMDIDNYDVMTTGIGTINVVASDLEIYDVIRYPNNNTKIWPFVDGQIFAASLTQQGVALLTRYPLSAGDRARVEDYLRNDAGLPGPFDTTFYFYSVEEQIISGSGFELNGATITYENGYMIFSDTSIWQQIATANYNPIDAQNPEIEIRNEYTVNTMLITIKKLITGNFGDMLREFNFTVSVDKGDPIGDFTLGHNDTEELTVRADATLTLTEVNSGDYEVTVMVGGDEISPNENGSYTIVVSEMDGLEILVTNNLDVDIDTGISLDSLPYILILGLSTIGLSSGFIIKRSKED